MPSVEKATSAEEPPRAFREVDRPNRNPEKLANVGGNQTPKKGLSDVWRCADSKKKTRLKPDAKQL